MSKIYLKVYTREPDANCYPEGLAYGIHMAYSHDGEEYFPLHKNYGILFAEGQITESNTIVPKGVKEPKIVELEDGRYGIIAIRTNENGEEDESAETQFLLWETKDFINYKDVGLVPAGQLDGKKICNPLMIDVEAVVDALTYWNPIACKEVRVPSQVKVNKEEELDAIKAAVLYTDGSTVDKCIVWDKSGIDFSTPGIYEVKGNIKRPKYQFPLTEGYGDPVIFRWEEKWYYIATNDNLDDIGLYVREADTVEGLFEKGIEEHLILPYDEERELIQTFWAPEFHVIGGELYILFAVSGKKWGPQCHLMKFKKGGSLINPESWEDPVRVLKKDGSFLAQEGITLDMTYIKTPGCSYMVWSYREHIMSPGDTGSMLYIASVDEAEPWRLTSEPVLLTRPLFGWENVEGTINNEGPYAFVQDDMVYLAYSGGAANGYTYALGMLTACINDDLLDIKAWQKRKTPVLTFYSVEGEYGPGHNSFYRNEDGELMIAYHGETSIESNLRCDGIRRVHFRKNGLPDFEMAPEDDLCENMRDISITVTIE